MANDPGLRRLILGTLLAAVPGTSAEEPQLTLVDDGLAGFTLFGRNIIDQQQLTDLTAALRGRRGDLLLALDEEGGDVTRLAHTTGSPYPGNAALGAVDDRDLTRQVYRAIGQELAGVGVNLDLAPTVDVNTADDNPVIGTRSFAADPAAVAAHGCAAVAGLHDAGVVACAKHYPGHGATVEDSHLLLPTVAASLPVLRARDLPPFAAVIEAGVRAVMTAHIRVPELTGDAPATFSAAAMDLLRSGYGFTGVIVTDALEMAGAARTAGGIGPAAVGALRAGADLLCLGAEVGADLVEAVVDAVAAAVSAGTLPLARLEEAAGRTHTLAGSSRPAGDGTGSGAPADNLVGNQAGGAATDAAAADGAGDRAVAGGSDLGYQVARRAVRIEGAPGPLAGALVVQLSAESSIAEGRVPWGLRPHLPAGTVEVLTAAQTSADELRERAAGRPVVLVGRHLHRDGAARTLAEKLAATHSCVVVEMGWPSRWRPAGARAFVLSFGASHANGAAVTSALFPPPGRS